MKPTIKKLIEQKDNNGLQELLADKPSLANEGITIPYDFFCHTKAHPLHRLCDAVFAGKMTDEEAITLAETLLKNGANINGDRLGGTPLLAAASLHAEKLGIFYIDNGADIDFTDENDNASALHWAAFCGRDKLVDRLIKSKASLDNPDKTYQCTPLAWAIHCLMSNDKGNRHNQETCIKLLLQAGADINKLSEDHNKYLHSIGETDSELNDLLKRLD
ncbi:ankyrin repeat domain-containing protein [Flavobacterium dauae]|uniref:ankyrin repeat domain-containing protein n=1 Tax=Flavobacterium dauae TaxID=1563479 RepID=UPI00101B4ECC|nr:ankyrin repeat domain-containing protein [Flavobacterium dauae]WLD23690.1 ankyrin repeat domain-containing protein [Flavobacterium dauae]